MIDKYNLLQKGKWRERLAVQEEMSATELISHCIYHCILPDLLASHEVRPTLLADDMASFPLANQRLEDMLQLLQLKSDDYSEFSLHFQNSPGCSGL